MIIDGHPKEKKVMEAFHRGNRADGLKIQDEFIEDLHDAMKTQHHCSCKKAYKFHGKCIECVAIHRTHQNHLPNCFRIMVNQKISKISELTEHTVIDDLEK